MHTFTSHCLALISALMMAVPLAAPPVSAIDPGEHLFCFERSTNRNYICYDIRLADGRLVTDDPLNVYWIRAEEDGQRKELSFIQRKFAFGYKVVKRGNNESFIKLNAYDKFQVRICCRGGQWIALATIDGQEARLTRLFAQMRSPKSLHVEHVDIYGISTANGKPVHQRIKN